MLIENVYLPRVGWMLSGLAGQDSPRLSNTCQFEVADILPGRRLSLPGNSFPYLAAPFPTWRQLSLNLKGTLLDLAAAVLTWQQLPNQAEIFLILEVVPHPCLSVEFRIYELLSLTIAFRQVFPLGCQQFALFCL
jgi:hypothetical protein